MPTLAHAEREDMYLCRARGPLVNLHGLLFVIP